MGYVLFIHRGQVFSDRMKSEAAQAGFADILCASSMQKSMDIITASEIPLSAIYVDATDTSYSLLKFIEVTLQHRPITPLFLIDHEMNLSADGCDEFLKQIHVQKVFKGGRSFLELTESINLATPPLFQSLARMQSSRSDHGYIGIPVVDFIHEKVYPFDVFIETKENGFSLFAAANSPVDLDYLLHAARSTLFLHVNEQHILDRKSSLQMTRGSYLNMDHISPLWKTAEALYNAKQILSEFRRDGASDHLMDQTLKMLGEVFHLVSMMASDQANKHLTYFVEQAKSSDQTIATITLCMLMCRHFKFERSAVIEILGIASLLQDISLFHSPYGDLSNAAYDDLAPDAQSYYKIHPLISADLLAQNTTVPDVVLQVIRQQHECRDKTGFPNRIGGVQLHPMAEVLSLINAFLDVTRNSPTIVSFEVYQKLERSVFSHYSESVVNSFKSMMNAFMRSNNHAYSRETV